MPEILEQEEEYSIDDQDYVRVLCDRGDELCFFALLQTMERQAYAYARRYVNDATLAEDVMQLAYMNALKGFRAKSYDPARKLRPWFYTIITRVAIDLLRKNKHYAHQVSVDKRHGPRDADESLSVADLLTEVRDPAERMDRSERASMLAACISSLSGDQRDAIMLILEGCKYAEVAATLDIPLGTAKSRVHAAKKALRELLGQRGFLRAA